MILNCALDIEARHGLTTRQRKIAANPRRNDVVPSGPKIENTLFAMEAPHVIEAIEPITLRAARETEDPDEEFCAMFEKG